MNKQKMMLTEALVATAQGLRCINCGELVEDKMHSRWLTKDGIVAECCPAKEEKCTEEKI